METPYAQYVPVLAAPELVLLAGLRWPTEYWAGLAIGWLEQGVGVRPSSEAQATPAPEPTYPCADCGVPRTKAQGGRTFTVCDECWDKQLQGDVPETKERG